VECPAGGVTDDPNNPNVYTDLDTPGEPVACVVAIDNIGTGGYPKELVNIPAGYSVKITYDGGNEITVYLPHITGDDLILGGMEWFSLYMSPPMALPITMKH